MLRAGNASRAHRRGRNQVAAVLYLRPDRDNPPDAGCVPAYRPIVHRHEQLQPGRQGVSDAQRP